VSLRDAAAALGIPVGAVLEGGYALNALARSVVVTMEVLGGLAPSDGAVGVADVSGHALTRLAEFWPELA
jgi:acetoin utilization deacetylase AcuC-like enzyme